MNLVLEDIDYFLSFARTGLLSQAAQSHNVAQSTVVNAIRRVESHFGLVLMVRNSHGTRITPAGLQFVPAAQSLSSGLADAIHVLSELRDQQAGVIRIGLPDAVRASHASAVIADLLATRPGMRVRIRSGCTDGTVKRALVDGELDMALVPLYEDTPPDCDCIEVGQDPLVPVVRSDHPLMKKHPLSLADVQPYAWSTGPAHMHSSRFLRDAFAKQGLREPVIALEVEFISEFAASVIRRTDLVMFVSRSMLRMDFVADLQVLPLPELYCHRPVAVLVRKQLQSSPPVEAFRMAFVAAVREMLEGMQQPGE